MTGFKLIRQETLELLNSTFHEFAHTSTGAKHVHLTNDSELISFAAIVRTVPEDSTGAPHILEHCVLSGGSKRYPDAKSRETLRISGGGAWTGLDYTWYFYQSGVASDMIKHVDATLDLLFEPLLEEETFMRQAHHLDFEVQDDSSSTLRIKGVIFNEQKGIFSMPIYRSWLENCAALFPDSPYALEHGGDPREIVKISWGDLKAFHTKNYHPANSFFVSWGDLPLAELHSVMDVALERVPFRQNTQVPIPRVQKFVTPVRRTSKVPVSPDQSPDVVTVFASWITANSTDPFEMLMHDVIQEILMGTSGILRKALVSSGLGTGVPDTLDRFGFRLADMLFVAGLADVDPKKVDSFESLVADTLTEVVSSGLERQVIEDAMYAIEFSRRMLRGSPGPSEEGSPTTLFIHHLNTPWVNGGDPYDALALAPQLAELQERLSKGRPVEEYIRTWLIDNTHRAIVVLEPDVEATARLEADERNYLNSAARKLTDKDKENILDQSARIRKHQEEKSKPGKIPSPTSLKSIPPRPSPHPVVSDASGVRVESYAMATEGISYVDIYADIGNLPHELWDYLHLLTLAIPQAVRREAPLGDISAEVLLPLDGEGKRHVRLLRVGGFALERYQEELARRLVGVLASGEISTEVASGCIAQATSKLEQDIYINATALQTLQAGSHVRESLQLLNRMSGFPQLEMLRQITLQKSDCVEKLRSIREFLAQHGVIQVLTLTSSSDAAELLVKHLGEDLSSLARGGEPGGFLPDEMSYADNIHEVRTWGNPAAFNCEVIRVPGIDHPDRAALALATSLMSHQVRIDVIRKGTAYSASSLLLASGVVRNSSIRDPNLAGTYRAFTDGARLIERPIDQDLLDAAKFELTVSQDYPAQPLTKARSTFLNRMSGIGDDSVNSMRTKLIDATAHQVQQSAEAHLSRGGPKMTLASAEMVESAKSEGLILTDVRPI